MTTVLVIGALAIVTILIVTKAADREDKGTPEEARPDSPYDYRLKYWESGAGRGYVVVRNSDGQRLRSATLPKSKGLEAIEVAGESYHMEELQSSAFEPGQRLSLVREPDNPHSEDGTATKIMDADEELHVGYIPSEHSTRIAEKLDSGDDLEAYSMWERRAEGERVSLRVLLLEEGASVALP